MVGQLVLAASEPPVNEIVLVAAVVVNVPPHTGETTKSEMDRPSGRMSVKTMPVKFLFPGCVLLIVNESVEFAPFTIGSGEKDLVMVGGGAGIAHPVNEISSKKRFDPELSLFAPVPVILIVVVPVVLANVDRSIVLVFHESGVKEPPDSEYVAAVPDPLPT